VTSLHTDEIRGAVPPLEVLAEYHWIDNEIYDLPVPKDHVQISVWRDSILEPWRYQVFVRGIVATAEQASYPDAQRLAQHQVDRMRAVGQTPTLAIWDGNAQVLSIVKEF
jgi:hypothetical protein